MRNEIPSNVRDAVLRGADIVASFTTVEDRFTGRNTVIRTGEVEPDGTGFVIPFTAKIEFGRPRRVTA